MKEKMKEGAALLLFCVLLPYVIATFTGNIKLEDTQLEQSELVIVCQSENGTEKIPLNTFLTGALAASITQTAEQETLKAQAVILRTNIYEAYMRRTDKSKREVDGKILGQESLSVWQMRSLWGEAFAENYDKFKSAVEDTEQMIITYEGIPIKDPFFYVSTGKTREGSETFGSGEDYPYLKSVECRQDMMCPDYCVTYTYPVRLFDEKMAQFFQDEKFYGENNPADRIKFTKDQAEYIRTVQNCNNGKKLSGEAFRDFLKLPSSAFVLVKKDNTIEITVKGQGHGVGMSQYGANELVKQGKDYQEIINTFFQNVTIQKYE